MEDPRIEQIILQQNVTEKDSCTLTAMIDDKSDLLLEGYDLGETPQEFWGDDDYEYWWIIKKKHKGKVLRLLVKERFDTNSDLEKWLDEKGIPGRSLRTIDKDYKDTALLWLIKERFDSDFNTDVDFAKWLKRHRIPKLFWSWV